VVVGRVRVGEAGMSVARVFNRVSPDYRCASNRLMANYVESFP
jgi:hypothetical protein